MKLLILLLAVTTSLAALIVPTTLKGKCLECIYEGFTFCDTDADQIGGVMVSSESCVGAESRCPNGHKPKRAFAACNPVKYFNPNKPSCKDITITENTLQEGRDMGMDGKYEGLMPNHTVSLKSNSGCKFSVGSEVSDASFGGFNFLMN